MCLSIHPCICPSLCSSSHPSIYLAIHEFIWTWTFLAIFRSSDPCVHRSFHLPVYCSCSCCVVVLVVVVVVVVAVVFVVVVVVVVVVLVVVVVVV